MKISRLIEELEDTMKREGDIQVTCTHSTDAEQPTPQLNGGPYETTVENLVIQKPTKEWDAKRVRLYL